MIAPRDGTLRELYGSLAPIGVVTEAEDELIACPGRDQRVSAGDRVTVIVEVEKPLSMTVPALSFTEDCAALTGPGVNVTTAVSVITMASVVSVPV